MSVNEYLYVKYVKTAELQRVLNYLNGNEIGKVTATRAYSKNVNRLPIPDLPYISVNELKTNKLKIDFNSLINGAFSKEQTFNLLNSVDDEPLSVVLHDLHVFTKNNEFIGNILANETGNDAFRKKEYVAVFKDYPVSREGETNKFVEEILNFRENYEASLNAYKLHSLDFKYVMCTQQWREISKMSKVTKEFNSAVEQWSEYLSECDNNLIKKIVENIFPRDVTSGRTYRKGAIKGRWILDTCGENV